MAAREVKAGGAYVELSIRDKTTQSLNRAAGKLRAFAGGVKTFSVAAGALSSFVTGLGVVRTVKAFADMGSEIHDMSQRTGLAADNLSELKYAADQTGTSIGEVEKALRFMQKQ